MSAQLHVQDVVRHGLARDLSLTIIAPRPRVPRPIAPLRRLPRAGKPKPLTCPYCEKRTAKALGGRCYQCFNADCPGGPEELFQFSSVLVIDAIRGARLVTWRKARVLKEERRQDPLAALRS